MCTYTALHILVQHDMLYKGTGRGTHDSVWPLLATFPSSLLPLLLTKYTLV